MNLKMWDSQLQSYLILSNIKSVDSYKAVTQYYDEKNGWRVVLTQWVDPKDNHNRVASCYPKPLNWLFKENLNVMFAYDFSLIASPKNEQSACSCKIITVNGRMLSKTDNKIIPVTYLLNWDSPVYLLNEDGKTIDTL